MTVVIDLRQLTDDYQERYAQAEACGWAEARRRGEGWSESWAERWAHRYIEGWVRGVLEGAKHSLLRLLELRGVAVPIEVRERILACTDPVQLDLWFDRAFTAATAEDVVQVD